MEEQEEGWLLPGHATRTGGVWGLERSLRTQGERIDTDIPEDGLAARDGPLTSGEA